jgi:hypothetical protein
MWLIARRTISLIPFTPTTGPLILNTFVGSLRAQYGSVFRPHFTPLRQQICGRLRRVSGPIPQAHCPVARACCCVSAATFLL